MMVYVLTMYDPAAQTGYTEVFYSMASAIRYTGLKGWKRRGDMWIWKDGGVKVSKNRDTLYFQHETEVYKIRRKRVRGRRK